MSTESASPPPLPLQEDEAVVDTHTPYQAAELRAATTMKDIRECLTVVDRLTASDTLARRLELHNAIRRSEAELRMTMLEARRLAVMERRVESYGKLQQQCTTTQQLIRVHYGALAGLAAGANAFALMDDVGAEPTGLSTAAGEEDGPNGMHYDIAQDVEFQNFFVETRQNDAQIDAALDRIEFGVQRVNENAQGIHYELYEQRSMLREAEKQAERNEAQLNTMNRRVFKLIQKLGRSRLITYVVLCVILIVLIIVVIFLGKSI